MSDFEDNDILSEIDDFDDNINIVDEEGADESDGEFDEYETFDNTFSNDIPIYNNFLNIYEITLLIGYRASQISNGQKSFLPESTAKNLCNPLLIAEEEFKRGMISFDIIRHINVGKEIKNVILDVGKDLHILDVGNMI